MLLTPPALPTPTAPSPATSTANSPSPSPSPSPADLALDRDLGRALALIVARARALALAADPGRTRARARSRGRDLDRDLLVADPGRTRARARSRGRDLDRDLLVARALARVLDPARAVAGDLDSALARVLDPDRDPFLDPASALDRDVDIVLARLLARLLGRALARDPDLACAVDRPFDSTVGLVGIPEIPLMWIASGPLGRASRETVAAYTSFRRARQAFADELTSIAGIKGTTQIMALLDGSLAGALRDIGSPDSSSDHAGPRWDPAAGANRLADASAPLLNEHQRSNGPEAAGIRAVALALASDSASRDGNAVKVFLAAAATVTLLQQREQGEARIGESIILALA